MRSVFVNRRGPVDERLVMLGVEIFRPVIRLFDVQTTEFEGNDHFVLHLIQRRQSARGERSIVVRRRKTARLRFVRLDDQTRWNRVERMEKQKIDEEEKESVHLANSIDAVRMITEMNNEGLESNDQRQSFSIL